MKMISIAGTRLQFKKPIIPGMIVAEGQVGFAGRTFVNNATTCNPELLRPSVKNYLYEFILMITGSPANIQSM